MALVLIVLGFDCSQALTDDVKPNAPVFTFAMLARLFQSEAFYMGVATKEEVEAGLRKLSFAVQ